MIIVIFFKLFGKNNNGFVTQTLQKDIDVISQPHATIKKHGDCPYKDCCMGLSQFFYLEGNLSTLMIYSA